MRTGLVDKRWQKHCWELGFQLATDKSLLTNGARIAYGTVLGGSHI